MLHYLFRNQTMKNYRLIFFLLILMKTSVYSQGCLSYVPRQNIDVTSDLICPDLLLEDLQFLHERLLAAHPNLFLYTSPQLFDSAYSEAVLLCSKPQTLYSFTIILNQFLSSVKDSHTSINCMELLQFNRRQRYYFPITLKTIESKLYVTKNYKDLLPEGAELLEFDNLSLKQCIAESELLSPIEANAISAQKEVADVLLGRILNIKSPIESHLITYVNAKNDTIQTRVKSPKYKRTNGDGEWPNVKKSICFTIDNQRAILSISTFFPLFEHSFKRQLDRAFAEIILQKPKVLLIDLRSNSGGFILLQEYLSSFLTSQSNTYATNYIYKRSPYDRFSEFSFFQKQMFKKIVKHQYPNGAISKEYDFYNSPMGSIDTVLDQKHYKNKYGLLYEGPCHVLINGLTMSAASNFTSWFKQNNRGLVIGTPCMGSMTYTCGNPASFILRNTYLPVSISTVKFTPQQFSTLELEAIQPDVFISTTVKDLQNKVDPFLKIKH